MIKTFKSKTEEDVFNGKKSKKVPYHIQKRLKMKLLLINAAKNISDLKIPPANHLEKLIGDRLGQYSIKVNDKYRICFRFSNGDAFDVEFVDYH